MFTKGRKKGSAFMAKKKGTAKQEWMMRYIVPFCFSGEYERTCKYLDASTALWQLEKLSGGYVYNHICQTLSYIPDNNILQGSTWKLRESGFQLEMSLKKNGEPRRVIISDSGVYLFRTGIGLFWYEISFKDRDISVENLIEYQGVLKNLGEKCSIYRVEDKSFEIPRKEEAECTKEQIQEEWSVLMIRDVMDPIPDCGIEVKNEEKGLLEKKIYLENTFDRKISVSSLKENAIRANFRLTRLERDAAGKYKKAYVKYQEKEEFSIGKWIYEKLQVLSCDVSFHMLRGLLNSKDKNKDDFYDGRIPKCALLYNYFAYDKETNEASCEQQLDQELLNRAVLLTGGHNRRYLQAKDMSDHAYHPFKNAYWYVSDEGCGCYVYKNEKNREYLESNLSDKVRKEYFILYMLLLYQSYSLLHFSEKIEYELSADAKEYLDSSDAYNQQLKEIQTEINTFLLKSVHTSVSQVRSQNDFYNFAKKQLRIREEIQSLTAGVDFLEELLETQEEKRQRDKEIEEEKHQREREKAEQEQREAEQRKRQDEDDRLSLGVTALSLLTVISAFADAVGFLDDVYEKGIGALFGRGIAYPILLCIVTVVGIIAGVVFIKTCFKVLSQ